MMQVLVKTPQNVVFFVQNIPFKSYEDQKYIAFCPRDLIDRLVLEIDDKLQEPNRISISGVDDNETLKSVKNKIAITYGHNLKGSERFTYNESNEEGFKIMINNRELSQYVEESGLVKLGGLRIRCIDLVDSKEKEKSV